MPKATGAIGVKLRIGRVRLYGGKTTADDFAKFALEAQVGLNVKFQ